MPDLAAAIACAVAPDDLSLLLTLRSNDPEFAVRQGWHVLPGDDLGLTRYQVPRAVLAAGHLTDVIAFTDNTVFAVIARSDPAAIGKTLGVVPDIDDATVYMGARKVSETTEIDPQSGERSIVLMALQVTTWWSRRGETLVGCSYSTRPT